LVVAKNDAEPPAAPSLFHPVYLDVPMMISFLAALRDGVAFEDTLTRRDSQSASRDREGSARVRLPSLGSLLGFDASGRMASSSQGETSEEVMAVRRHTEASLFNALYAALTEDGLLRDVSEPANLADIAPGDVVELSGDFVGNPLEPVVAFFKQALPYFDIAEEAEAAPATDAEALVAETTATEAEADDLARQAANAARSGSPATKAQGVEIRQRADAKRASAEELREAADAAVALGRGQQEQLMGLRLLTQVGEDLATTPVQDTVMIAGGGLKAVLTMSAEFFTEATRAHLRAGVFRVVGKVTRVLTDGDDVNLLRRTVLGAAGPDVARDMLKGVAQGELQLETFDPIIQAPAVQVLPLAVFV
jgi:hypothetical protein